MFEPFSDGLLWTAPHRCPWILQMLWQWQEECFSSPNSERQLFAEGSQSTMALLSTAGAYPGELWESFSGLWGRTDTFLCSLAWGGPSLLWWVALYLASRMQPCHGPVRPHSRRDSGWPGGCHKSLGDSHVPSAFPTWIQSFPRSSPHSVCFKNWSSSLLHAHRVPGSLFCVLHH